MKVILIEISQNDDGMWRAEMEGVNVVKSPLSLYVRNVVGRVIELNPDVEFEVVDKQKNARTNGR